MIAVTMGDPAGIGPEVVIKGFVAGGPKRIHVGEPAVYRRAAERLGFSLSFQEVETPEAAAALSLQQFAILPVHARSAPEATLESVLTACRLAVEGRVQAVVTPPINKSVLHQAGFSFPGHTELLGQCAGVERPVMMLVGEGARAGDWLRVVPVTIHQSLRSVAETLTADLLRHTIQVVYTALSRDFALEQPQIVVTGLNPHAGEEGAFGREELDIIAPVCRELAERWPGVIRGPLAADSLFHPEVRKTYDAVICMYHDQALIPLKMLAFGRAVNVTLGLPIVRTSVDHGTAYPIAGLGIADPRSYMQAVLMAVELAANRRL
ncbi:MAG: 4-hydroxythreonine-4-phosphate dehydrogenase PdxA [Magnetococcus sp. XQGC-1]